MRIGKMGRALAALLVVGALVIGNPLAAPAETTCGAVVCATADGTATWTCTLEDLGWSMAAVCGGVATATGGGSSDLSIPGSATWSGSESCDYVPDSGTGGLCASPQSQSPATCTWAGLGEDSCSGSGSLTISGYTFGLSSGQCLGALLVSYGYDYVLRATASSTASKSLPVLGSVDSAVANAAVSGSLREQSATVCAP